MFLSFILPLNVLQGLSSGNRYIEFSQFCKRLKVISMAEIFYILQAKFHGSLLHHMHEKTPQQVQLY